MDDLSSRYDKEYIYGSVTFYLKNFWPDLEQCRFLILKVLEQTIRDYISLGKSEVSNERMQHETARSFLYDDNYQIWWGEKDLTTRQFLDMVDLDLDWVREQTTKKLKERNLHNG